MTMDRLNNSNSSWENFFNDDSVTKKLEQCLDPLKSKITKDIGENNGSDSLSAQVLIKIVSSIYKLQSKVCESFKNKNLLFKRLPQSLFRLNELDVSNQKDQQHSERQSLEPFLTLITESLKLESFKDCALVSDKIDKMDIEEGAIFLEKVYRQLLNHNYLTNPSIFLQQGFSQEKLLELNEAIQKLKLSVTENAANATHIIHNSEIQNMNHGNTKSRIVSSTINKDLVHTLYYPSSHDIWITKEANTAEHLPPVPKNQNTWNLSYKWIFDSLSFSEIMNEAEYLVGEIPNHSNNTGLVSSENEHAMDVDSKEPDLDFGESDLDSLDDRDSDVPVDDIFDELEPLEHGHGEGISDSGDVNITTVNLEVDKNKLGIKKKSELEPITNGEIINLGNSTPLPPPATSGIPETNATNTADSMEDVQYTKVSSTDPKPGNTIPDSISAQSDTEIKHQSDTPEETSKSNLNEAGTTENVGNLNTDQEVLPTGEAPSNENIEKETKEPNPDKVEAAVRPEQVLAEQKYEIVIPSYAAWFSISKIHENERRANPEFFNNINKSKTPRVYMEYRNFMINTYRLYPMEYLTVTACRRNLSGDVCSIMRVHSFLEQWGLINYQADPESRPSLIGPPFTGHFKITAETPRGLVPMFPSAPVPTSKSIQNTTDDMINGTAQKVPQGYAQAPNPLLARAPDPMDTRSNIFNASSAAQGTGVSLSAGKKFVCFTCGNSCDDTRYHCIKPIRQQLDLCPPCFLDGRFPSALNSADFVKLSNTSSNNIIDIGKPADKWSDQETLLLLEGLEMYDENWTKIAEHVGTRTREECVLHFLQLPISDPVDSQFPSVHSQTELNDLASTDNKNNYGYPYTPFSKADNPVMSVVAFLAANVHPSVAAAAAKEALRALSKTMQSSNTSEISPEKKSSQTGDSFEGTKTEQKPVEINQILEKPSDKNNQQIAAALGLSAAAAKASALADREEAAMQLFVHQAVELQLAKLEFKVKVLEEMQLAIEQERNDLARQRMLLAEERISFNRKVAMYDMKIQKNIPHLGSKPVEPSITEKTEEDGSKPLVNNPNANLSVTNIPPSNSTTLNSSGGEAAISLHSKHDPTIPETGSNILPQSKLINSNVELQQNTENTMMDLDDTHENLLPKTTSGEKSVVIDTTKINFSANITPEVLPVVPEQGVSKAVINTDTVKMETLPSMVAHSVIQPETTFGDDLSKKMDVE
ncbi:hypothetical protein BB559_002211 [Furculomyces boomerangus]|uniref:SWIRM domain-containing protein n=2 Tax=Harpellales TaxID=61421 RepID=A0A2T9YX58_9FUNG|nr:hypothetical protein BB559_002211 [Furculomyces boomerangus]PVZ99552.1 hypothetical protein BB558_004453 [Smittium angustum]